MSFNIKSLNLELLQKDINDKSKTVHHKNILNPIRTTKEIQKKTSFSKNSDILVKNKVSEKALKRKKILNKLTIDTVNSKSRLPGVKNELKKPKQKSSANAALRYEEIKNRIKDVSFCMFYLIMLF